MVKKECSKKGSCKDVLPSALPFSRSEVVKYIVFLNLRNLLINVNVIQCKLKFVERFSIVKRYVRN